MTKIACLIIPHLPIQVEPALADVPLVVGGRPWDEGAVLDCCPRAWAAGVRPGERLAQAEKLCPSAVFLPAQEEAYRAAHDALLAAAGRFTPTVETAGLGRVYAEVTGLERTVGPDQELAGRLCREAERASGLRAQVGIAAGKYPAEQAAEAAQMGQGIAIPAGETGAFLAPLPVGALPLEPEMGRRLALLGIGTLGELAALPRNALVRQFGPSAGPLHDLATGIDPRPVQPEAPPLVVERRRILPEPLSGRTQLSAQLARMAAEVGAELARRGYQAEGVRLSLLGRSAGMAVRPPTAEGERLARLAEGLLERIAPDRPVAMLALAGYPLRPAHLGLVQGTLFEGGQDGRGERLRETLRGLRARFGEFVVRVAALIGPPPPRPVEATVGPGGEPRALVWDERIRPVATIYEGWRERRRWWGRPVERDYWRLETDDGLVRVVYRDLRTEGWWLERRPD